MSDEIKDSTPVVTDIVDLEQQEDFFHADVAEGFVGRWADKNHRRIEELKRKGYEMDPSSSSVEAGRKRDEQIALMEKRINNPNTKPADKQTSADIITQLKQTPIATETSLPHNILMRTTEKNYAARQAMKVQRAEKMKGKMEEDIDRLNHAVRAAGVGGGMKAFMEMTQGENREKPTGKTKYFHSK